MNLIILASLVLIANSNPQYPASTYPIINRSWLSWPTTSYIYSLFPLSWRATSQNLGFSSLQNLDSWSHYNVSSTKWEVFKTTWLLYDDQPRTLDEAKSNGWTMVSNDCSPNAKFPGHRYAPPKRGKPPTMSFSKFGPSGTLPEIIVIYDKNGFVAGIHHLATTPNRYDWFEGKQWFQTDIVAGEEVEMTTMYFINPKLICGQGRTAEVFEKQGTGNLLALRNGPKYTDVFKIPLTEQNIKNNDKFHLHRCLPTMGNHWMTAPRFDLPGSCNSHSEVPIQVLTDQDGDVNGFAMFIFGKNLTGYRYEIPSSKTDGSMKDRGCITDYLRNGTLFTMHVYLKQDPGNFVTGPKVTCPKSEYLEKLEQFWKEKLKNNQASNVTKV